MLLPISGSPGGCGKRRGGPTELLPRPTPGTQDWRLPREGQAWPRGRGGGCGSVGASGPGLSSEQEAAEGPTAWALVQMGRPGRHPALSPAHQRKAPSTARSLFFFFFFLALLHSLWNLSSLTRDRTCTFCIGSVSVCVQSYLTFCDPMDCCLPGSSVHGIFR